MADRIVQPKVLASTNPDTYDNLIMQQAQNSTNVTTTINGNAISDIFENNGTVVKNATNAASATNGIFMQRFSNWVEFVGWMINNESCLYFDVIFNSSLSISDCPEYVLTPSSNLISYSIEGTYTFNSNCSYRFIKQSSRQLNSSPIDMYTHSSQFSNAQSTYLFNASLSKFRSAGGWLVYGNSTTINATTLNFTSIPFDTSFSPSNVTIEAYYTNN